MNCVQDLQDPDGVGSPEGRRRPRPIRIAIVASAMSLLLPAGAVPVAAADHSAPAIVHDTTWYLRDTVDAGTADHTFRYGRVDDRPALCDWDGDGTATPGLLQRTANERWRWLLRDDLSGGTATTSLVYGLATDATVCGDWDGDGTETPGVVRSRSDDRFEWHLSNSQDGGGADVRFVYGSRLHDDLDRYPVWFVVGDWDGDGDDTVGIVRFRTDRRFAWHLRNEHAGGAADLSYVYYGDARSGDDQDFDIPIAGDWDGDGEDTAGVVRKRNLGNPTWLLRDRHSGGPADVTFAYGPAGNLQWPLVWSP